VKLENFQKRLRLRALGRRNYCKNLFSFIKYLRKRLMAQGIRLMA